MRPVYVKGSAISTTWADASCSLTDLIYRCTTAALSNSRVRASDLDAVVLSAHDLVDGRGLTNMVTAPAAAAYLKDETRLGEDGAAAFVLAEARVRSGSVDTCLVAAWGRASEGPVDKISHALFDPFTMRPLAMTETAVSGLRAAAATAKFPGYAEHRSAANARRHGDSREPQRAPAAPWPLQGPDLPLWADVVVAVVLSCEPSAVKVLGVGMSTEPFEIGDRDLLGFPALRSASAQALAEAAVDIADVEILEIDALTTFDEALATEAVGAAPQGFGMQLLAQGTRVNPDGGSAAGYCAPAMGLVRIARAAERLDREAGKYALATGSSVVASQTQAAVVLGKV